MCQDLNELLQNWSSPKNLNNPTWKFEGPPRTAFPDLLPENVSFRLFALCLVKKIWNLEKRII